jgi:hypothetical protein
MSDSTQQVPTVIFLDKDMEYTSIYYPNGICSFGGSLATLRGPQLGAIAIREAVARAGIPPEMIQVRQKYHCAAIENPNEMKY